MSLLFISVLRLCKKYKIPGRNPMNRIIIDTNRPSESLELILSNETRKARTRVPIISNTPKNL